MPSPLETLRAEMAASLAKVEHDLADWKRRRDPGERPLTDEREVALAAFLGGVQRRLDALEAPAPARATENEDPSPAAAGDPENRRKVLDVLRASPEHFLQPGAIAEESGLDREVVRAIAREMAAAGMISREVRQFGPVYSVREAAAQKPGAVTIEMVDLSASTGRSGWKARPAGDLAREAGGFGYTYREALGELVDCCPELFGVVVARATP